jgi:WD repeat-containing protein 35
MRKLLIALSGKICQIVSLTALSRGGNPKGAIDCCVIQNRWDLALSLAEEHDFPQVEGLLARYAQNLLSKGKRLEAVELYRRANRPTDSAILIGDIAEQV